MFHEPQKEQTAASGVTAIEAEGEFVETRELDPARVSA